MSSLLGLRVVRGPDWKWGEQDGGEGHVGTVIENPNSGRSQLGSRKVTVILDSRIQGHYRAGPKGSYDLRIVDNPVGELHENIFCGYPNCLAVIRGIRWKCADCELNLCTSCFLKEKPHNEDHSRYQRFDNSRVTNPPTVCSWNGDGPDSRINLMGIFPGAEVMKGSIWPYGRETLHRRGVVIPTLKGGKGGRACVNWISTNKRCLEKRCSKSQLAICAKEAVLGGYYSPECLPIVNDESVEKDQSIQPGLDAEITSWIKKGSTLFFKAVEIGNLKGAQLLFKKDKAVADARNADGKTALQVACIMGHKDIVEWLIDEVRINLEERDRETGFRAIHHAVKECQLEVLSFLVERGAQLDTAILGSKRSPLHIAISNQFTECARLLIQHGCNVNFQDCNGSTPFMNAIRFPKTPAIIQMLASSGRIDWKVKDKQGYNILHHSVLKNNLKALDYILPNMDKDLLLEPMLETKSTVLHHASEGRNFEVAKLLLDHYMDASDPASLKRLLEARNPSGRTALLVAVEQKDFPLIELFIGAGADLKAVDENGNTTLIHASMTASKENCNQLKKFLSHTLLKELEKYPALYFIGYLIERGFSWTMTNSSGSKPADYLINQGYPMEAIDILNEMSAKMQISIRRSSGGTGCMGRDDCIHPPAFQLSCPHKPMYKTCSKCFVKCFASAKCGCDDEEVTSILPVAVSSTQNQAIFDPIRVKVEPEEESSSSVEDTQSGRVVKEKSEEPSVFWFKDESKNGCCQDESGFKYSFESNRKDGSISYRCTEMAADSVEGSGRRCPSVVNKLEEKIVLEKPHDHYLRKKKKSSSPDGLGPPQPKRMKKAAAEY